MNKTPEYFGVKSDPSEAQKLHGSLSQFRMACKRVQKNNESVEKAQARRAANTAALLKVKKKHAPGATSSIPSLSPTDRP